MIDLRKLHSNCTQVKVPSSLADVHGLEVALAMKLTLPMRKPPEQGIRRSKLRKSRMAARQSRKQAEVDWGGESTVELKAKL